ncbi:MAG: hypothetical protein A2505_03300 [Deltaproteobacteria bacterium RIFOXYD12_FULL_55_16]|nr:MAG: hypothetical protein A2505_03300 [Deltaproteobacteria bacterium RIFOXYD12_FULL_55_16]
MSRTGWILVLLSATLAVGANLLFRSGVERAGGLILSFGGVINLLRQPRFDLGFILYAVTTILWIKVISIEPLSVAYPVLVSITFLLVTLGAAVLFRENLNWQKLLGLAVILAGIFIISRS